MVRSPVLYGRNIAHNQQIGSCPYGAPTNAVLRITQSMNHQRVALGTPYGVQPSLAQFCAPLHHLFVVFGFRVSGSHGTVVGAVIGKYCMSSECRSASRVPNARAGALRARSASGEPAASSTGLALSGLGDASRDFPVYRRPDHGRALDAKHHRPYPVHRRNRREFRTAKNHSYGPTSIDR